MPPRSRRPVATSRSTPRRSRRSTPGTNRSRPAVTAWPCSTSMICCCTPRPRSKTTMRSHRNSATATAASSSTSIRTSPRCSSGCSTPGSAAATTSPSSATPTRRSTRSPAPRRVIAAARGRMAGSKLHLVGQRDPGPNPTYTEHPDEAAEAATVAKKIKNLIDSGTAASEIAVLYRINAQSEVYEEALTEAGVPFQVRGGEGFFSRQEIRQALLALQRASEKDAEGTLPDIVRAVLEPLGLTAEPPAGTRARERWEALVALAELVDEEVALRPTLDLRALVAELRQRADARHPPVVQGVTLASLHAAKGLEWDAVFLVGLADN